MTDFIVSASIIGVAAGFLFERPMVGFLAAMAVLAVGFFFYMSERP